METFNIKQVSAITSMSRHRIYRLIQAIGDERLGLERGQCNAVVFNTESIARLLDADKLLRVEKLELDEVISVMNHNLAEEEKMSTDLAVTDNSINSQAVDIKDNIEIMVRLSASLKTMSRTIFDEILQTQKKISDQQIKMEELNNKLEVAKAQNDMVLADLFRIRKDSENMAKALDKIAVNGENKGFLSWLKRALPLPFKGLFKKNEIKGDELKKGDSGQYNCDNQEKMAA